MKPSVVVFGGTGFLGRRVVRRLSAHGFKVRIASRHPETVRVRDDDGMLEPVRADVSDATSVKAALAGAYGAVNAVSLYVERGGQSFHSVHVEAARQVAALAREAGLERFVHVSGIGSDPGSTSLYIRKRGEGEAAVREALPGAVVLRPAVMIGSDDAFLRTIVGLLRRSPVYPLFGRGRTRLQPVAVEDIGNAIATCFAVGEPPGPLLECGGPRVYAYRDLIATVARCVNAKALLLPVPFGVWKLLALGGEMLPKPPLTRNQVELMEIDNVPSGRYPGLSDLGISPRALEEVVTQLSSG